MYGKKIHFISPYDVARTTRKESDTKGKYAGWFLSLGEVDFDLRLTKYFHEANCFQGRFYNI